MGFLTQKEYVIITKHSIVIFYVFAKFFIWFFIAFWLAVFIDTFKETIWTDVILYFLLPVNLIILNYSFWKLIQGLIFYYNDLVIFIHDKIIIVKSSLVIQDDLEIIEVGKVMKIDVHCHWFFANLLGYGNLIIEQQRDQLRILHFIPQPYKALQSLREKTTYVNTNQDLSFFKLN